MADPAADSPNFGRARIDSLDLLRGAVMVLMALDHARDFFTPTNYMPEDLTQSASAWFWTRWVTHFCAPVFVFLAGTGAYLYGRKVPGRTVLSRFLISRGLWLVVLEFTVVHLGWWFTFSNGWEGGPRTLLVAQVIWAIGASMIVMGLLVWLPTVCVAAVGILIVAGHNALDGKTGAEFGILPALWNLLHVGRSFLQPHEQIFVNVMYPLLPWLGVMAAGYGFGAVMKLPIADRRRACLAVGVVLIAAFVVLRGINQYGDPQAWSAVPPVQDTPSPAEKSPTYPLLSFLNTTKYPPSLLFVLMTLGPAILILPLLERVRGPLASFFTTFGRVPLFYYVLHIPLLNAAAAMYFQIRFGVNRWNAGLMMGPPEGFVAELWVTYVAWAAAVLALWPLCRWWAGVKARHRSAWMSYL